MTIPLPWRWLPAVRRAERGPFLLLGALGALVTLAQTVGLAGAEAVFLTRVGAERLPVTFVLASALTVVASLAYAVRVGRARNDRVLVELLLLAALAVAAATLALARGLAGAATALLCLFFAAQAVLTSHFWTLVGDFFDTLAAKRVVPLFTVAMSAGGALGGGAALALLAPGDARVAAPPAQLLLWAWAAGLAAAALGIAAGRGRFASGRAVAGLEEDETSVAGMRAALAHVRRSRLARWLAVSALAMVLALFVAQYLYSAIFAAAFPDEAALARFLALYLAASNALEIGIELAVTPWLIRRLGVPTANLLHPALTMAAFAALAVAPRLPAAIAARADRELLESALAGPVRNLAYNALPVRFRSRVRAFLEGIVVYSGMSVAGLALLAADPLGPRPLAAVGIGLAALYLLANARVRRAYVHAIADELRAGRLDLRAIGDELGPHELAELAALWRHLVERDAGEPDEAVLALPRLLAARGHAEVVRRGLAHPSPALRAACLAALSAAGGDAAPGRRDWQAALGDPDARVRRTALRMLPEAALGEPPLEAALHACLGDRDVRVRAAAAARAGAAGEPVLEALLAAPEPAAVAAALEALPPGRAARAAARIDDPDPALRAAALAALARAVPPAPLPLEALRRRLADPEPAVRRSAVAALAARPESEALAALAEALRDPAHDVRRAAVAALAAHGAAGARAAEPVLRADEEAAIGAALRVLGAVGDPAARLQLRRAYAGAVAEAWESLLLANHFAGAGAPHGFLAVACADAAGRAVRTALRALARLESETLVRGVARAALVGAGRTRADALEALSQLGPREPSEALAVLLEASPIEDKRGALRALAAPPRGREEALARARAHPVPWVRAAAAGTADSDTVRRLLALRRVSLLAGLPLERLQAVERIATESEYAAGETIVREGDPGDELFLLVEGRVEVWKARGTPAAARINTLGPGDYFGEMAVLDGSPRSATLVAAEPVRVLVLAGARLRELVQEMPELAFDLMRVLAARVRRAEERSAAGPPLAR